MKPLINRLICIVRGHKYGEVRQGTKRVVESVLLGLVGFHKVNYRKCTRCGKNMNTNSNKSNE